MNRKSVRLLIAATAAIVLAASPKAEANPRLLKSNVVIVKPQYHAKTIEAFRSWALALAKDARKVERTAPKQAALLAQLAQYYDMQSRSTGHGSGWLWIPEGSGNAYVITNKHVAGQAGSVAIEFANDRHPRIRGNPVIYVDPEIDMAVIEVPRDRLPAEATGFELIERPLTEGNPVWAAGFPGTATNAGMVAAYSLTNGVVSNAEYPGVPGGHGIAHTATIDPGNSGGPLLTEVPTAPLGYRVSGMNTWKSLQRSNVNIAVPASTLAAVLRSAERSRRTAASHALLVASLRESTERLAVELGSTQPDYQLLNQLIGYSFVAERPEMLGLPIQLLRSGKMTKEQLQQFVESPVEYTRTLLWVLFFQGFSTGDSSVGDVRLDAITDEDRVSTSRQVRTIYTIAGKRQEIFWAWEHGAWRISNASFEHAFRDGKKVQRVESDGREDAEVEGEAAAPGPRSPAGERGYSIGFRLGIGSSSASDDNVSSELSSTSSRSFDIDVAFPLDRRFAIVTGLGYSPHGVAYDLRAGDALLEINEELKYLQIPALLRLELPLVSESATLRGFGKAGLGLDIVVSEGGDYDSFEVGSGSLSSIDYYQQHNTVNLAAILGAGLEIGLGDRPAWFFGLDVTHDRHLLDEWTDDFFTGEENFKYRATRIGLVVRHQPRP